MCLFWTVLLGIQAGGREQMICSKWKVEMFAKGLKMVYVSLTYRNINSISLILLLLVFHFGSHPLIIFFSFLHNHDWQDLFPGDCMSWPLLTLVSGPGCDASWLAEALLGRHSVSDTGPHQFCYWQFPDSPLSHLWWPTGTQILQWAGILCGELSFICVFSASLSPYPL